MGAPVRLCATCRERPVLELPPTIAALVEEDRAIAPHLCAKCDAALMAAHRRGEVKLLSDAEFAAALREARQRRGLSVAVLAYLTGVSASTILRGEARRVGRPSTPTLAKLFRVFEQYGAAPRLDVAAPDRVRWCSSCGDRPAMQPPLPYCRVCHEAVSAAIARGEVTLGRSLELGAFLRISRRGHRLSVRALANRAGVSASTIKRLESGHGGWPRTSTIRRLGDALEAAGIADRCAVR